MRALSSETFQVVSVGLLTIQTAVHLSRSQEALVFDLPSIVCYISSVTETIHAARLSTVVASFKFVRFPAYLNRNISSFRHKITHAISFNHPRRFVLANSIFASTKIKLVAVSVRTQHEKSTEPTRRNQGPRKDSLPTGTDIILR